MKQVLSMKRYLIAALALVVLSCTMAEVEFDNTPVFVLSAALPDADTKTTLSADDGAGNFDILWKEGDKISVSGKLSDPVSA